MSETAFPCDPAVISREISIPLKDWAGNCHGVAKGILERLPVAGMRLVRGHYDGFISRDSVYRGSVQQHSWLELDDGRILDPTRWCMDRPDKPYLYIGENDAYDEAGIMLSCMTRTAARASIWSIGAPQPEDHVARILEGLKPELRAEIHEAIGGASSTAYSVFEAIAAPVEHLKDPERLYRALEAGGMRALLKMDNWIRVMEPERVTPPHGVNHFYALPQREEMTEAQILFRTFCKFLSLEHRGDRIEAEMEELGYTLSELHDALNRMESMLRINPELDWLPPEDRHLLSFAAMDILGKGFGEELRVERFTASLGMSRRELDGALRRFAEPSGLDLSWIWPPEPDAPEEASLEM